MRKQHELLLDYPMIQRKYLSFI